MHDPDLGMPKVDPRVEKFTLARRELGQLLSEWQRKHGLTTSEVLHALSIEQTDWLRVCVQSERDEQDARRKGRKKENE